MEKAILFEPKLLAEIEHESPDLYDFYCDCPLSKMEFVDYGHKGTHCYIQKETMAGLKLVFEIESLSIDSIIKPFQAGYNFGVMDLEKKFPGDCYELIEERELLLGVFDLILNYHYYEIESLLDGNNYGVRDGLLYNKIIYKEAQYHLAWETLLRHHEDFNDVFEGLNRMRRTHQEEFNKIINSGFYYN